MAFAFCPKKFGPSSFIPFGQFELFLLRSTIPSHPSSSSIIANSKTIAPLHNSGGGGGRRGKGGMRRRMRMMKKKIEDQRRRRRMEWMGCEAGRGTWGGGMEFVPN